MGAMDRQGRRGLRLDELSAAAQVVKVRHPLFTRNRKSTDINGKVRRITVEVVYLGLLPTHVPTHGRRSPWNHRCLERRALGNREPIPLGPHVVFDGD